MPMPPRRGAAQAASAAISALSAGEPHDVAATFSDDYESEHEHTRGKKAKANKQILAISSVKNTVLIRKPAPIDGLPYELRREITQYLDPFTLLSLLSTSKIWYLTLRQSEHAEKDWERLCNLMYAKRKSRGRRSWHATFIHLLHSHCVICLAKTKEPVGELFLFGYTYIKACRDCQKLPGPMQVASMNVLARRHNLILEDLHTLPYGFGYGLARKSSLMQNTIKDSWITSGSGQFRLTCDGAVRQLKLYLQNMEPDLIERCPFDKKLLVKALVHIQQERQPVSTLLNRAVATLRLAPEPMQDEHYKAVIDLFRAMETVMEILRESCAKEKVVLWQDYPTPHFIWCSVTNIVWIDALILGKTDCEKYIRAVKDFQSRREKAEERERNATKSNSSRKQFML